MKIKQLYTMLCRLYGIPPAIDIDRFMLTDDCQSSDVVIGNRISGREALLIRQRGNDLEIGLFIAPKIIEMLGESSPLDRPDAFCCAAEGVSHFLYACDRIEKEMKFTKLELELQAEVDKFILLHIIAAMKSGIVSSDLFSLQFEKYRFDPSLTPVESNRYMEANRLAAKFCHHILTNYFNPLRFYGLIPEVRDFFSRNLTEKVARLTP